MICEQIANAVGRHDNFFPKWTALITGMDDNYPIKPCYQITISLSLCPYIFCRSSGENLLKYQETLTSVIKFSIPVISLTDKLLILQ